MRQLIFSALFMLLCAGAVGQQAPAEQAGLQQDYQTKSRKQKRAGTLLLLGGVGLIATGFIIPRGELESGICIGLLCSTKHENDKTKSAFLIAGGVLALSSIPLFAASGKNRKRAASMGFKLEQAHPLYSRDLVYSSYPALRISTTF